MLLIHKNLAINQKMCLSQESSKYIVICLRVWHNIAKYVKIIIYKFHNLILNFELIGSLIFCILYGKNRQFVPFTGLFSESRT